MRFAALAVLVLAAPAFAEGKEQPLDAFLEQRVAEELASDGLLLSRLGVTLDIDIVGDTVLVSLIDSTTSRAVASTKVDRVPGDREAAVAQVTQVASSLADQITRNVPPVSDDRSDRESLAAREYLYRQGEVTFGERERLSETSTAYLGVEHRPLTEVELFRTVGRPDLAERYQFRHRGGIAAGLIGGAAMIGGLAVAIWDSPREFHPRFYTLTGVTVAGAGFITMLVGIYYGAQPLPVSPSEVYDLAAAHNRKLRAKYNLPATVAPYASPDGGGVAVGGEF